MYFFFNLTRKSPEQPHWTIFQFINYDKITFFLARTLSKFFQLPSASKKYRLSFDFALERYAKNIFYYQRDGENYTGQVIDFLLFDRHECIDMEDSNSVFIERPAENKNLSTLKFAARAICSDTRILTDLDRLFSTIICLF